MPTYQYQCSHCEGVLEVWQSMKEPPLRECTCGGPLQRLYTRLRTIGVGAEGQEYLEVEAREARWAKDMPAYKRFRERGLQPPQIDGCDYLEATAQNNLWVNSGGRLRVDEAKMIEAREMAEDIAAGRL